MRLGKKILSATMALAIGSGLAGAARAQNAAPSDPQTIINNLLQQLNQAQNAQNNSPSAAQPTQPVTPPTAPAPTQAPPAVAALSGATLNMENIPQFVASLGYEAKKINDNCYEINASRDNWTLYVNIYPDTYQKKLWFFAYMRKIEDMSKVPTDAFLKLLEANNNIGPTHFYMANNVIYMGRAFENEGVTPAKFRHELDQFFADCQKTEDLWSVERWNTNNTQLSSTQTAPAVPTPTP
jgi:hypothetical protein